MKQLQGSFPIYEVSFELNIDPGGADEIAPRCAGEEAFFHV
jgi:hypothetical protein